MSSAARLRGNSAYSRDLRGEPARHFTRTLAGGFAVAFGNLPSELRSAAHLRVSANPRDTKISRKDTKTHQGSKP